MATRPIDEKIVAMKLDNSDFDRKAAETTGILGKLRDSLNKIPGVNLGRITDDLSGIQKAAGNVDLTEMASHVDSIAGRFTNLGIIATTALQNITNKAVDAGMRLAKSLGMDQVTAGFGEYETKIGAVQTILANTEWAGTNLDDVKKTLGELNDYADETIYSFEQMTQNVGRFTTAGATLEDSAIAIQGLGNLAAISGTDVQHLNTVMFQMSQAMSAGRVGLQDWVSLETASMAGKKTQEALIATAESMGKVVNKSKPFRQTLQDGWLTADVFLQTMKEFGKDESMIDAATKVRTFTGMMAALKEGIGSGWAETWEFVFGDFEEATKLWTGLSVGINKFFDGMAYNRNKLFGEIAEKKGFVNIFNGIQNIARSIFGVFEAIGNGIQRAFPSNPQGIVNLTRTFVRFTKAIEISGPTLGKITKIIHGLFAPFSAIITIITSVIGALFGLIPSIEGTSFGILDLLVKVAELSISFSEWITSINILETVTTPLEFIFTGIAIAIGLVISALSGFTDIVSEAWNILSKGFATDKGPWAKDSLIVDWLLAVRDGFKSFGETLKNMESPLTVINNIWTGFVNVLVDGWNFIKGIFSGIGNFFKSLGEAIANNQGYILGGGALAVLAAIGWRVWDLFSNFSDILGGVKDFFEGFNDALAAVKWSVYANAMISVAIAMGILSASLYVISKLDADKIGMTLTTMIMSISTLVGALAVMNKFSITGNMGTATSLMGIAAAIGIMAIAVKIMGDLDPAQVATAVGAMAVMLLSMAGSMAIMSKFGKFKITTTALQFVGLATAMLIMASAIEKMATIKVGPLAAAVVSIALILGSIAVFFIAMDEYNMSIKNSLGIIAVAGAVWIIADAISRLSEIKEGPLTAALGTIMLVLASIIGFAAVTEKMNLIRSGIGLLILAGALQALAIPILAFAVIPFKILAKGLAQMALTLTAVGIAAKLMLGTVRGAIAMLILAGALHALLIPILAFSVVPFNVLMVGLGQIALTILAIGLAARVLQGSIAGVLTIGILAGVLMLLVTPLSLFAQVPFGKMVAAILGFAGAIVTFAAVALLIAPAAVPMLILAGVITALGVAMLAAGAGMSFFATGLLTLSTLTVGAVGAIVVGIGAFLTGLTLLVPAFTDLVGKIFGSMLEAFARNTPAIADAGAKLIIAILDGIERNMPGIVDSAILLMDTMARTIEEKGPLLKNTFLRLFYNIAIAINEALGEINKAVFGWIPGYKKSVDTLTDATTKSLKEKLKTLDVGKEKVDEFRKGVESKKAEARKSGEGVANESKKGIEGVDTIPSGESFGDGFIKGIINKQGAVGDASESMAQAALDRMNSTLGVSSPARETEKTGYYSGEGAALGIKKSTPLVEKASENMGKAAVKGVKKGSKGTKAAGKSAGDAAKEGFDKAMSAAREKFSFGEINSKQYLAELEKIKKSYSKYPQMVKEVNREIKQAQEDVRRKEFELAKQNIDDRKYYNNLTLNQELTLWQKILAATKKGSAERKEAEREVYRVKKEIADKEFSDFKAQLDNRRYYNRLTLTQEYDLWKDRLKTAKKGSAEYKEAEREIYRIKNEMNQKISEANKDFLEKTKDLNQQAADEEKRLNEEYKNAIKERTRSLVGFAGLFEKVNKGNRVSGNTLIKNLKSQVGEFSKWATNIQTLSNRGIDKGLLEELRQMGPSARGEIAALTTMTDAQLTEYAGLWKSKNELARTEATAELEPMRIATEAAIDKLKAATSAKLTEYTNEWIAKIKEIRYGTPKEFVGLNDSMTTIGKNAIASLTKGMGEMKGPLATEAAALAGTITETIKKTLKMKSPSRILMGLGESAGEGLAIGIGNMIGQVGANAKSLATTATETINEFLDTFEVPDEDSELHFKAVIDYDKLDTSRFGVPPLSVIPDTSFATRNLNAARPVNRQNADIIPRNPTVEKQPTVINQNLTFHSPQLTPSEVARKNLQASRQLAMQWGV